MNWTLLIQNNEESNYDRSRTPHECCHYLLENNTYLLLMSENELSFKF